MTNRQGNDSVIADLPTPVLGYGCSRLIAHSNTREALNTLNVAFDSGIKYYDVARLYGYGRAETILGKFIRDKRHHVCIATKGGLSPREFPSWVGISVINVLRRTARIATLLGGRQSIGQVLVKDHQVSIDKLTKDLERSLVELQTDYVDVYLLHEVSWPQAQSEEMIGFCHKIISEGKARTVGIGAEYCSHLNPAQLQAPYSMLQHSYKVSETEAVRLAPGVIRSLHGVYREAEQFRNKLKNVEVVETFRKILGDSMSSNETLQEVFLNLAKTINKNGIVLFSTADASRVKKTCKAWDKPFLDDSQIQALRHLFLQTLP